MPRTHPHHERKKRQQRYGPVGRQHGFMRRVLHGPEQLVPRIQEGLDGTGHGSGSEVEGSLLRGHAALLRGEGPSRLFGGEAFAGGASRGACRSSPVLPAPVLPPTTGLFRQQSELLPRPGSLLSGSAATSERFTLPIVHGLPGFSETVFPPTTGPLSVLSSNGQSSHAAQVGEQPMSSLGAKKLRLRLLWTELREQLLAVQVSRRFENV